MTKKAKKKIKKRKIKPETILLIVFLLLCVVVFVLAIVLVTKKSDYQKDKFNINIPVTKEELEKGINIEVLTKELKKNESKEYKFRVVNYINDKVNKENLTYKIAVKTSSKSSLNIELYSTEESKELLEAKQQVKGLLLEKDKKEEITYTLKITKKTNKDTSDVNIIISEDK